ncbi:3-deoxy-D-manno-octulosonic acid kinase [Aliikangiella sp. IMCC44632]
MSIIVKTTATHQLLLTDINPDLNQVAKPEWFQIDYWRQINAVKGQSKGRNTTWFVGHADETWVLRHYYRGGMVANLSSDKFIYFGQTNSRVYQELQLLETMYLSGLPVPKPVAGLITRHGISYQADLLMQQIADAQDLVAILTQQAMAEAQWRNIGVMLAQFHQNGIYHSDLNAHNILMDQQNKAWLIDFDKCQRRPVARQWQAANLARLKRSFMKESQLYDSFYFDEQAWHWLVQAYQTH